MHIFLHDGMLGIQSTVHHCLNVGTKGNAKQTNILPTTLQTCVQEVMHGIKQLSYSLKGILCGSKTAISPSVKCGESDLTQ